MNCPHCNKHITNKEYMSELGKRSSNLMTPEQRKERATKAAQARWGDKTSKS